MLVRIGLHGGRPTLTPTGYVGISVNTAARICAMADGGQVLVSRTVTSGLGRRASLELRALGTHRLRGIPDPVELWEARPAG